MQYKYLPSRDEANDLWLDKQHATLSLNGPETGDWFGLSHTYQLVEHCSCFAQDHVWSD